MKPVFKPKKVLTKTQKELMKKHKAHHTKKHLDYMKMKMLEGYCFQQAHELANKNVGK